MIEAEAVTPRRHILDALSDEEIVYSNPLATITTNWIVIPDSANRSRTILSIHRLSEVQAVTVTYPALLVIAGGLLVLAAASLSSKQGSAAAAIPIALIALVLLLAYLVSRQAWVEFTVGERISRTSGGTRPQAEELALAVERAQADLIRAAHTRAELVS